MTDSHNWSCFGEGKVPTIQLINTVIIKEQFGFIISPKACGLVQKKTIAGTRPVPIQDSSPDSALPIT